MSRRIRALLALVLVSFALTAATACADVSGPTTSGVCDQSNPNTCH